MVRERIIFKSVRERDKEKKRRGKKRKNHTGERVEIK
jgi:hypothetical protein